LFIKKLVETNYYGNMFIKEQIEIHTINMVVDDSIKIGISCNLSNKKLVEKGINDFLERQ